MSFSSQSLHIYLFFLKRPQKFEIFVSSNGQKLNNLTSPSWKKSEAEVN